MLFRSHKPPPPLSDCVDWLWFYEGLFPLHRRERVLPDGSVELIINLREEPRHVFDPISQHPLHDFRGSWISGPHSRFIVIDTAPDSSMIGAHFKPGGATAILGIPASDLHNQVVHLSALLEGASGGLRDQLLEAATAERKFKVLEGWLVERWLKRPQSYPAIRYALNRFTSCPDQVTVSQVTREIGLSRRHFIQRFTDQVGLPPKLFCRVRRFQRAVNGLKRDLNLSWAAVAVEGGYYDQSHFIHDFQEFCGLTPTRLAGEKIEYPNLVPIFP